MRAVGRLAASFFAGLLLVGCRRPTREVVVFRAASLTHPLANVVRAYQEQHPDVTIRLEPSGSQVAARKVSEQGMPADIVAVADAKVIERVLREVPPR
jgi:molybdate/tungstate transport system substrate-binding protein